MKRVPIILLILAAFVVSLGSCVNEVKNIPASISHLTIVYSIPDSNNIRNVSFHASLDSLSKNYRFDWRFSDTTLVIYRYDTAGIYFQFKSFGAKKITLSVVDTQKNVILGTANLDLIINDNAIDTNYLHSFTKMSLFFNAKCLCLTEKDSTVNINTYSQGITWIGKKFIIGYSSHDTGSVEISESGNIISSAWFKSSGYSWFRAGQHNFEVDAYVKYIEFKSPLKFRNNDSMIFSCSAKEINSNIRSLVDTTMVYSTTLYPPDYDSFYSNAKFNRTLEYIYYDTQPPPILTVKIYK